MGPITEAAGGKISISSLQASECEKVESKTILESVLYYFKSFNAYTDIHICISIYVCVI